MQLEELVTIETITQNKQIYINLRFANALLSELCYRKSINTFSLIGPILLDFVSRGIQDCEQLMLLFSMLFYYELNSNGCFHSI